MLAFFSVGLPVIFVGVIAMLYPIFERLLDRFPELEHLLGL